MLSGLNFLTYNPPKICLFKDSKRSRCEICSKVTIKTQERRPGVFLVDFEQTNVSCEISSI